MITFIVHDLSRNLEDQVLVEYSEHGKHIFEPYHLQYSNFDMIKFLMSSNNDALERPTSQVPQLVTVPGNDTNSYLCCVGTHADKVCSDVVHKINSRLVNMVEKLDCKATVWRNKDSGVLFPVDNTTAGRENTEDPTAKLIRNEIETLSLKKDVYELPITWMLLELEIRQVCTGRGTAYISFQECVSIASQSNLITDVEQVRSALLYHHLLGVLLYYPEVSGLCDYIIIDHQWLFDRLSKIVCFTFKKSLSNQSATNKLKHSGILSKELLQSLQWEDDLKQDYFVSLLVVMKIISPIPREDGDGEDYFIPYVLPTYTSQPTGDLILSQYGCLQGEPLLIQFVSNLLPRGFFCCLIVEIMQHLPRGWSHLFTQNEVCHSFSNLITFRLPHAYLLSLLDKLSYLEVQIRHEEKDYHKKCPIHLSVQDILASALENVCEQLNFNNGRLQYGFHCQCGKSDDKHIAILTTLSPPFDYAQCSHGRVTSTKLQHSHIVWLTEKFDETANRAAEDQNDYGLPEYKVFTDYYSKLVDTIPACDLSHYFVSENVISLTDHEEITKPTTPSHRTAQLLLNKVLYMLKEHKSVDCFNRMVSIMEHHGDSATRALSQEIQSRLLKINSCQQDLLEPHSTTLEAAPPLNIVPGQLIIEDLQSPEYLVIIKHYSKLVDALTAKTLSHYFVSHKIISTKEEEEITKPTTSSVRAATLLLSRVINPLRAGFENCTDNFYIFLNITEQYGNGDIRHLSTTIRKKVNQMKTEAEVKGSGDKSAVLTKQMDNK
ncbi:uncharacterized protein [Dysidea avara]|uniref:uncharacterized protein n=1 Tax=Dysidea avara TaxID=196820 RepID=UPI00331689DC